MIKLLALFVLAFGTAAVATVIGIALLEVWLGWREAGRQNR